jgi:hypothetical protein
MQIYPNLFAYLNQDRPLETNQIIHGRNRPVVVLTNDEELKLNQPLLLCLKPQCNEYEIAIPYLHATDLEHHQHELFYSLLIATNQHGYTLLLTDEVIDEASFESEEQLTEWKNSQWCKYLDRSVAELLQVLIGLLGNDQLWSNRQGNQAEIRLLELLNHLSEVDLKEANLPLLIWLERKYELSQKLRQITPKMRHQLRRKAELMPIGRIQEMDTNCLRDYIRRPGSTPEEKAGARQELMGVQRYQDFNTYENKFLVDFASKLSLECFRYRQSDAQAHREQVQKIQQVIDRFEQEPTVQVISARHYRLGSPNYVMQQNPIYSSFYRAYLDYLKRQTEKERIWSFRNQLLGDILYLCLHTALLCFQGANIRPLAKLAIRTSPDQGHYLSKSGDTQTISVALRRSVYEFHLQRPDTALYGDFYLRVRHHDLYSRELSTYEQNYPFWVFWYKPDEVALAQAEIYLQKLPLSFPVGIIAYLQEPPAVSSETGRLSCQSKRLWLCQLPDLLKAGSFTIWLDFLVALVKNLMEAE